ncbi:MAG: universal stress protein [Alphaproteobacteria bacterium]
MYDNILLPVDLGDDSSKEKAFPTAVEYCRAFGARLHIMSVVPDFGAAAVSSFFPDDFADKAVAQTKEGLQKLADAHAGDIDCSVIAAYGNIYEEILRVSRDINADLIVMASHRPKLEDYLLGPNAARVVRHAPVSVLVVR